MPKLKCKKGNSHGRDMEPAGKDQYATMPYEMAGEKSWEAKRLPSFEVRYIIASGTLKKSAASCGFIEQKLREP
jgi:hypothetical protein